MNIAELAARFEYYAVNNKQIAHDPASDSKSFLLCDVQDVQVSIQNGLKLPCMLMQTPDVEKDGDYDNITEHFEGSFVILDSFPAGSDAATKIAIIDRCKAISDKVYNRMLKDADTYFDGALVKTAEGSFGPVSNVLLGWGVNFGFEQGYNGEVDNDDWADLD